MKLQWTFPAVNDLEGIRDHIAKDSVVYAARFVERILDTVEILIDSPEIGRVVPEADDPDIREILFQNIRIMYRLHTSSIQIIAIVHGSRDIGRLPLKPWELG